jgi:hypothetical protein
MGVCCQGHTSAAVPPGKTRYPLYKKRLGGPRGRSGRPRKISSPPGFEVQTVASRHTGCDTRKLFHFASAAAGKGCMHLQDSVTRPTTVAMRCATLSVLLTLGVWERKSMFNDSVLVCSLFLTSQSTCAWVALDGRKSYSSAITESNRVPPRSPY